MSKSIISYQCPNCGAPLIWSEENQQTVCDSCSSSFSQGQLQEYDNELYEAAENTRWSKSDQEDISNQFPGMTEFSCPSCGASLCGDENTAATGCVYCGNPTLIPQKLTGLYKPDCLIPFKLDKAAAKKALKTFYRYKIFLPHGFKTENQIDKITGIYAPYWLFNCEADAHVVFNARNIREYSDSNYVYTETEHYKLIRDGSLKFENVPVDASSSLSDEYMDAVEPFDYSGLVPFSGAYLAGFTANKYDLSADDISFRAKARISKSMENELQKTTGFYDRIDVASNRCIVKNGRIDYALLPVWLLTTKYKDKAYTFMMNGQTGKLVGELPIDKKKTFMGTLILLGFFELLIHVILYLPGL